MSTMLLTTIILIGLALILTKFTLWGLRNYHEDMAFIAGFAAVVFLLAGIVIPASTYGERAYGRTECSNWGRQTGRPSKFVVYTSWDTGNCLTRGNDGKWISKDLVRQFGGGR